MQKTILVTGSTDGIGLATAKLLVVAGHRVLLHGRNEAKLADAKASLSALADDATVETYRADLSRLADVEQLAKALAQRHSKLDVLINNAGVYKAAHTVTPDGLDIRFVVNTIAPYLLTRRLLPMLGNGGRVVNLSSAAQAPVDINALYGKAKLADRDAYAQSKLAITMWSRGLALSLKDGPIVVAVNPGSLLGTKMVAEAFGPTDKDVGIGADILSRAALADEFATASGKYFDNDSGQFAPPHPDALDQAKIEELMRIVGELSETGQPSKPT